MFANILMAGGGSAFAASFLYTIATVGVNETNGNLCQQNSAGFFEAEYDITGRVLRRIHNDHWVYVHLRGGSRKDPPSVRGGHSIMKVQPSLPHKRTNSPRPRSPTTWHRRPCPTKECDPETPPARADEGPCPP